MTLFLQPAPQGVDAKATTIHPCLAEGGLRGCETKKICCHADLAITIRPRANADHGDAQLTPDAAGKLRWDVFQHQGEAPG